jgi:hypothetical protein
MTTTGHHPLSSSGTPGGRGAGPPGGRPSAATAAGRLPTAPRERKPALAALAVLLILGGALVSTSLVLSSGDRVSAIALAEDVPAGARIPASALREVKVAKTGGVEFVRYTRENVALVAQAYARVPLVEGSLLHRNQTIGHSFLEPGKVAVGLSLKPGQFPSELRQGQLVTAYLAGPADTGSNQGSAAGRPLVAQARVLSIAGTGESKRRLQTGGETLVTVVVDGREAGTLTPAASKGDVALVLLPPSGQ